VRAETRLPEPVEVAAYYIVSEALTNTAKHAHASAVHVVVEARDGVLGLSIHDDGRGGADPSRGSGLIGLTDRVDALGGTIEVESPSGAGTTLLISLPIEES
jgi:signal transduction histidine kinase